MRGLGGYLLLAGVWVGLFVYLPAPVDRQTSRDRAGCTAAAVASWTQQSSRPLAEPGPRTFSPGFSLTSGRGNPSVMRSGGWRTTASSEPQDTTSTPNKPEDRYQLVVDLQEQLKRVGCYYGRIDGSWGPGSKYAMQSFIDRVNAALPSEKPDYVLLTLLKSQSGKVCGACPSDQLVTSGGACVPRASIAYGQRVEDVPRAVAPGRETMRWQTTTAAARPAANVPVFKPLPASIVSTEPLPGSMSIGGPRDLPPVNTAYAPQTPAAGNGAMSVATTTTLGPRAGAPPTASVSSAPKPAKTYKRADHHRSDGPGTPRYNLMLGLGGVY